MALFARNCGLLYPRGNMWVVMLGNEGEGLSQFLLHLPIMKKDNRML